MKFTLLLVVLLLLLSLAYAHVEEEEQDYESSLKFASQGKFTFSKKKITFLFFL